MTGPLFRLRVRVRCRMYCWLCLVLFVSACQQNTDSTVQTDNQGPDKGEFAQVDSYQSDTTTTTTAATTATTTVDSRNDSRGYNESSEGEDSVGSDGGERADGDTEDNQGSVDDPNGERQESHDDRNEGDSGSGGKTDGDAPGPDESGDGPFGPVGRTGAADPGDAWGVELPNGDLAGALRIMPPEPPYLGMVDEILDLCDDSQAFAAMYARHLSQGEQITKDQLHEIAIDRVINEVTCDQPGGRRYVHISEVGPGGPFPTRQAAVNDFQQRNPFWTTRQIVRPRGKPLGFWGYLGWDFPLEDIDEVVVIPESVRVRKGTVRGLVRNLSKTLFAREVTVTATTDDPNVQSVSGRFPLTLQPGERGFFEIENWTGSGNKTDFDLNVTAKLSTEVDISRSFAFSYGGTILNALFTEEEFKEFVPSFTFEAEKDNIPEDRLFRIEPFYVSVYAPNSHPSLKNQILNQTIEDLRVYLLMAPDTENGVYDIIEPALYLGSVGQRPADYLQVVRQPTINGNFPFYGFEFTVVAGVYPHIWVGEPGPLDHDPRTVPDRGPPDPAMNPIIENPECLPPPDYDVLGPVPNEILICE